MKRIVLVLLLVFVGAASLTAQAQTSPVKMTRQEYVEKYKSIAIAHMKRFGIPASITMAQGILESSAGNSDLARRSNNHFGIKCKKNWTGAKVYHDDDAKGECFRAYPTVEASYEDHAKFLDESPRYDSLFAYPSNDYKSWARGLKACGYATAPDYAEKLIKVIESMKLYLLDEEGLKTATTESQTAESNGANTEGLKPEVKEAVNSPKVENTTKNKAPQQTPTTNQKPEKPQEQAKPQITAETSSHVEDNSVAVSDEHINPNDFRVTVNSHKGYNVYRSNTTFYVVAKSGDTFESIGKTFNISPRMLRRFNDVPKTEQLFKSNIVYIEPKKKAWLGSKMQHVVLKGENLYSLSQQYGIRMKSLRKLNKFTVEDEVKKGDMVKLK